MKFIISAQKMELTDALKQYIEQKFSKISKYSDKFFQTEVHLSKEKLTNQIHVSVKGLKKPLMAETHDNESMYKAIDLTVDKLEKQLRRGKEEHHQERETKEPTKNFT